MFYYLHRFFYKNLFLFRILRDFLYYYCRFFPFNLGSKGFLRGIPLRSQRLGYIQYLMRILQVGFRDLRR